MGQIQPKKLQGVVSICQGEAFGCGCQKRFGIPFWLVGEFTTHFRTYFSRDWDVYWGYGILTHGQMEELFLLFFFEFLGFP